MRRSGRVEKKSEVMGGGGGREWGSEVEQEREGRGVYVHICTCTSKC